MLLSLKPVLDSIDLSIKTSKQKDGTYRCIVFFKIKEDDSTQLSPLVLQGSLEEINLELSTNVIEHLESKVIPLANQINLISSQLKKVEKEKNDKATGKKQSTKQTAKKTDKKEDNSPQLDLMKEAEKAEKTEKPKRTRRTKQQIEKDKIEESAKSVEVVKPVEAEKPKDIEKPKQIQEPSLDFEIPSEEEKTVETVETQQQESLW